MKKIAVIIMVTVLVTAVLFLVTGKKEGDLVRPGTSSPTPVSTPNAPKTFKFDSSTDLKMELEKVNPQIFDSDFE